MTAAARVADRAHADARGSSPFVFEGRQIAKAYPGTVALKGIDFQLRDGSVHALIGENGAGKSTLAKIIAGVETPTTGTLLLDAREVHLTSTRDAAARGIAIVHQELQRFPNLSVAENLFIGRELRTRWGSVDLAAQEAAARAQLARLGQSIDPRAMVGRLPLGQQQIVEIARALTQDTRLLLMDEPTSALSVSEVEVLFRVIRDLRAHGVSIVYISHRLEELIAIADHVTVLRDGIVAGEAPTSEIDVRWIVERMTGRPAEASASGHATVPHSSMASDARVAGDASRAHVTTHDEDTALLLSVRALSLPRRPGRTPLDRIDLDLRAGEIVGIYGLMGAGRTELLESLMGIHADAHGRITLHPSSHTTVRLDALDTGDRVRAGLAIVPEDRQRAGLVSTMTVAQNMTLSSLPRYVRAGWLSPSSERKAAGDIGRDVRLKCPSLGAIVTALSGGNQQKVIIGRAVLGDPRVLLMDEPSRGVDVGARAEIIQCMQRLAAGGVGVIFTSSDLDEILAAATRVLVMARGRIAGVFNAAEATAAGLASCASAPAAAGDPAPRAAAVRPGSVANV